MNPVSIIIKKRDGFELNSDEISYMIKGITDGSIELYQASSFMMAIYFKGMTFDETYYLTKAMIETGDTYDLSMVKGIKVDKHSTGGVGDKVTLILAPILAALGFKVCKMSGRGLGHTGGTIDKLMSIKGFDTELSFNSFINQINEIGLAISSQTKNLVPADKVMYSLRDVCGSVESIPLIASSIMSKKIAMNSDIISLDIKVGSGAFMKSIPEAKILANTMVEIGKRFNVKVICNITNMDIPLGNAIGNSLEVIESVNTLLGNGPKDLTELCQLMASEILVLNGYDEATSKKMVLDVINNKAAYNKLVDMVKYQGGDISLILDTNNFNKTKYVYEYKSNKKGFVTKIDSYKIGLISSLIGAGRIKIDDIIDYDCGIILNKKINDIVNENDTLFTIYYNDINKFESVINLLNNIYEISNDKIEYKLVYEVSF